MIPSCSEILIHQHIIKVTSYLLKIIFVLHEMKTMTIDRLLFQKLIDHQCICGQPLRQPQRYLRPFATQTQHPCVPGTDSIVRQPHLSEENDSHVLDSPSTFLATAPEIGNFASSRPGLRANHELPNKRRGCDRAEVDQAVAELVHPHLIPAFIVSIRIRWKIHHHNFENKVLNY